MRKTYYHPLVPAEVRQFVSYYEDRSNSLADEFWNELKEAIDYASRFPERHHFDASGRRRSNLKRFPFHFLFRVYSDRIRVTVIRHNQQKPSHGIRRK
jgi:plasmid stabilization system protein ParE